MLTRIVQVTELYEIAAKGNTIIGIIGRFKTCIDIKILAEIFPYNL